jgi:hypothetical protein
VPEVLVVPELAVQGGWWRADAHVWGQLSLRRATALSPAATVEASWRPTWVVAPRVELRAGLAEDADRVLRTRLGGLNPYVVPVAGAAWGEWWVEDYAAARLGAELHLRPGAWAVDAGPLVDLARFDGDHAEGFGVGARVGRGRWYGEVVGGYAPWIARAEGFSRASVWFSLGADWG